MPIEFSTCLTRNLLYARWHGVVDFDQFEQNFHNYINDIHYQPGRPELIDHSAVTQFDASPGLIRSMLRQVNTQQPNLRVTTHTVVYSPHETLFGLGRMYQLLAELDHGIRVEVFREEREALAALGLEHPSIAALLEAERFDPPCPNTSDQRANATRL